jgi:putative transposase
LISEISGIDSSYEIPDELWNQIFPLLAHIPKRKKTGRPRMDDRKAMNAIFYIARTGCQWNALPRTLGASSTLHDRFQQWRQDGVFKRMWIDGLKIYDKKVGINWEWQSMDGAITKAPLGEKSTGPYLTDRSKSGTTRSLLVDGQGIPLGITVDVANRHDMKMTKATLQSTVVGRPPPPPSSSSTTNTQQQHICLNKGYDYPEVYEFLEEYGYTIHVCKRGEDYNNGNKKKRRGLGFHK